MPPAPQREPAAPLAAAGLDPAVDYIVELDCPRPVSGADLAEHADTLLGDGLVRPVHWEGYDDARELWRPVTPDGRYPRLMRALGGVKLLILDDWGLEPLGPEQRHDMLEIVEDRYGRGATLITSQTPVDRWHDLIGEPTLADAILDRIVHNAHRLQLNGDSLRKQNAPKIAAA